MKSIRSMAQARVLVSMGCQGSGTDAAGQGGTGGGTASTLSGYPSSGDGGGAGGAGTSSSSPPDGGIAEQSGRSYHVSPTGNDANPGTQAQPFRTIGRARDVVRTVNANMTSDIVVNIHGGTYNLTATVSFGPSDSGTNGYRVRYQAYPGETPIIMAATLVTGWSQYQGQIFRAPLTRSTKLRSLYVNEKRAYMASKAMNCSGSWGSYAVTSGSAPWAWSTGSQADGVEYSLSDFPAVSNNASDIEIESRSMWNTAIVCVREVTSDGTIGSSSCSSLTAPSLSAWIRAPGSPPEAGHPTRSRTRTSSSTRPVNSISTGRTGTSTTTPRPTKT